MLPRFSPDGRWIAFTSVHGATADVDIIPADGGPPRRLTYAAVPGIVRGAPDNMVVTWTPDSRSVVFLARKASWNRWVERPFAVSLDGGMPRPLPVDRSGFLSFGPDGRFALNRVMRDFDPWKRYEGGQAQAVSIYDPATRQLRTITDWKGTNAEPMWAGGKIYFLSDRDPTWRKNIWVEDLMSLLLGCFEPATTAASMAICRPEAIDDAPACWPERSGGWRRRDFLGFPRGMAEGQGKKVAPPPLRLRRSRRSRPSARSSH